MQEENFSKSVKPKTQYPYLSIDQIKRGPQKYCELKGQVSQFFNIKFDPRYHNKDFPQLPNKYESTANNNPDNSKAETQADILSKIIETPCENRRLSSDHHPKSKFKTQKMLQNIEKLLTQEKSFEFKYYLPTPDIKPKKKSSDHTLQKKNHTPIENILSIENNDQKPSAEKAKSIPFPQMLKKCSKLKDISRFEHELLNQKGLTGQGLGIRFYTQPFSSIEPKEDPIYQSNKFKVRPSIKKTVQTKLANFYHNNNLEPLKNSQKTLDIRKYTNHSVLKQRSKNAVKRHLLREQRFREHREVRMSEPVKIKTDKYEVNCEKSEDMVTPWDQKELKYDFQLL